MKKKVIILGSTGYIGKCTFNIFRRDKENFDIKLLSTNTNISLVIKQAQIFKVKNIIITDKFSYILALKKYKNLNINFFNNFLILDKLFKKKEIYYSMVSVVGINGLLPTLKSINFSKNIAIVNKESLVCAWPIIKKKLNLFKTNFIPIDSEHFSIYMLIKNHNMNDIKKIYITASGGPFLKKKNSKKKIPSIKQVLKHPNWNMGDKISVDSATLMNKIFEFIEAKNIFDISYDQLQILIHPDSYVHSIVEFNNGLIKMLAHEPKMTIPIKNSIYEKNLKINTKKKLNLKKLNNLGFDYPKVSKFPVIKILNKMPKFTSLYETSLVVINDYLVKLFLEKKINFNELNYFINKIVFKKEILALKKIPVKNFKQIEFLANNLSLKLDNLMYKS